MGRYDGRATDDRPAHVFEAGSEGGDGFLEVGGLARVYLQPRLDNNVGRRKLTMEEPSGPSSSGGGGMMRDELRAAHMRRGRRCTEREEGKNEAG
jgi:hypothetical protein